MYECYTRDSLSRVRFRRADDPGRQMGVNSARARVTDIRVVGRALTLRLWIG